MFLILAILLLYFQQSGYSLSESSMEKVGIFVVVVVSLLLLMGLFFALLEILLDIRR